MQRLIRAAACCVLVSALAACVVQPQRSVRQVPPPPPRPNPQVVALYITAWGQNKSCSKSYAKLERSGNA